MEIKKVLDEEFCVKLVQSASLIIGHNVLITDENGYILASSDATRIGSLHEASLSVIASGKQAYHDRGAASRLAGTMPGTTIPLSMDEISVGTIGITGPPEEISQYAMLIQQLSQLFLSFQGRQQSSVQTNYQRQGLLREIIAFDRHTSDLSAIYTSAYEIGIDLNILRVVILIRAMTAKRAPHSGEELAALRGQISLILSKVFCDAQDFVCMESDTEYVVMAAFPSYEAAELQEKIEEKCRNFEKLAAQEHKKISIGIGSYAGSIEALQTSYKNARFALKVLESRNIQGSYLFIDDAILEKLAVNLPDAICDEISSDFFQKILQAKNSEDTMQVIECWCRHKFHFSKTAEALHVHKSTLVYRFRRIQELFGLDLYDFDKVLALYLLNTRRRLK